ncbi:hypothetical protein [Teichococcus aestuarii]|uniref:hypothetical protein n=1 Tax=Teichococcus aestuarii TaxID=568898 RepID=UPI0036148E7B
MRSSHLSALLLATTALCALLAPRAGHAADNFNLDLNVGGQSYSRSYSTLDDLLSVLDPGGIQAIAPNYRPGVPVSAMVNLRGVPAQVVSTPGSSALRLVVPGAGVERTFDAGTLAASRRELESFAKGDAPGATEELQQIAKAVVSTTTADPVAGNPGSLLGQSVMADYAVATRLPGDLGDMTPRAAGWHFGAGVNFNSQSTRDFDTNVYQLPLTASYAFRQDGPEVFFNLPLSITETGGAVSYIGSGSLGVRLPVVTTPELRWAVTPAARWGAAGSEEIGAVGMVWGGSITSDLRIGLPGQLTLGVANGFGYYMTRPLKVGEYDVKYDLSNPYFRNGVSLTKPVGEVSGRPVTIGASFVDTRMTGSDLAVSNWQEYGVTATVGRVMPVRLSATYIDGERGYEGFRFGLSMAF